MIALSDDYMVELLENAKSAFEESFKESCHEYRILYATQSIAMSNLIIAELMMRNENNKNCKR